MKGFDIISKLLKFGLNLVFLIQIALMMLVFFTASYWFFSLLNSDLFEFAAPLASAITDFVKMFNDRDIEIDGKIVDASILLFDIITIIVVILMSKIKFYIYRAIEKIDYSIIVQKRKDEKRLNEELKKEMEESLKKYNNAVIVVEFEAKDMHLDSIWSENSNVSPKEKISEVLKEFYYTTRKLKDCTFAKTENRLAIIINRFERFDEVMTSIEQEIEHIRENMLSKNRNLITYIAVDTYYDNKDFKTDVYPALNMILSLKYQNQIVCYTNFYLRYTMAENDNAYDIVRKGDYNINGTSRIYNLVKKS